MNILCRYAHLWAYCSWCTNYIHCITRYHKHWIASFPFGVWLIIFITMLRFSLRLFMASSYHKWTIIQLFFYLFHCSSLKKKKERERDPFECTIARERCTYIYRQGKLFSWFLSSSINWLSLWLRTSFQGKKQSKEVASGVSVSWVYQIIETWNLYVDDHFLCKMSGLLYYQVLVSSRMRRSIWNGRFWFPL